MFKKMMYWGTMASAIGVPYLLSTSSDMWKSASAKFSSMTSASAAPANTTLPPKDAGGKRDGHSFYADVPTPNNAASKAPVEGYGVHDLSEVIHFDGTPGWVMTRWPRVTSGLAELDLQGYRVPLVTGTGEDDLAGSLTYYFDRNQRTAIIHFRGITGNPQKLVALVMSRYNFVQQTTADPSLMLYQVKWNGKPQSELRVRPMRIVRASQPNARYEVELALKRP